MFEVLNEAPLANVAPPGRPRVPPWKLIIPAAPVLRLEAETVPPLEERVPAVALIPPLRDKSAAPVTIFSPVLHPGSPAVLCSIPPLLHHQASKPYQPSQVCRQTGWRCHSIVESAAKRRVVELSGNTPPKSCTPATSRMPPESVSALAFVVNVVFICLQSCTGK